MNINRLTLAMVGAMVAGVAASAQAPPAAAPPSAAPAKLDHVNTLAAKLEPTRLVTYRTVDGRDLHLHVFNPAGWKAADKRACFLVVHGGGWVNGAPRRMYPFAAHFAGKGMVGISIEYRLMKKGDGGVTPFDCAADGRAAVRYVKAHAAELGVDPEKIVASGGSAGGHVAAGTALFDGIDAAGDDLKVDPRPAALVLYFPVIDTSAAGYGNKACGARWREVSPLHRVKRGAPPTIVFHGTADQTTPYAGARAFEAAMREAGNRCELVTHEGGKHGYLMFEKDVYDGAITRTEAFLASLGLVGK